MASALTKVTFTQSNTTNVYILSNFHTNFRVPHNDFFNYDEGNVNVSISHANSRDTTLGGISSQFGNILQLPFTAVQHMHSNNQDDTYTITPELPQQVFPNKILSFNLTFIQNVQNEVYLVSPSN